MRDKKGHFKKGNIPHNYRGENKVLFQDEKKVVILCESRKYGNKEVVIDSEDWERVRKYRWYIHLDSSGIVYVYANKKDEDRIKIIKLHRFIMNCPARKVVDHVDHNTCDNRKENMRICTKQQNNMNRRKGSANSSGFKGVVWHKQAQKWMAFIKVDRKHIYLGLFDDKHKAAQKYNETAIKLFGDFAYLNDCIV